MDWVSVKVALGGDAGNVMVREENPVSWPEVKILQNLHGEANVYDAALSGANHPTCRRRSCGS